MPKSLNYKSIFHTYASILVLALAAVTIGYLFWDLMLPRMDFYNELWGPAYMLVHGQSPYDTSSLNPELPAAWFPMVIGFFFPLGWLPETLALQVWYVFTILEICLIVYISQGEKRDLFNTMALALICFFFPVTLNHLNLGQLSLTITLSWIFAAYFLEKEKHWLAALCIALAMSKPHLGFLAMLGLSYRAYSRGGFRMVFLFLMRIFVMCLILCIPLFIADPNWIPDAIISMRENPRWLYPSLYILFERSFGSWGHVLWGISTLVVTGATFWLWKKLSMKDAIYWSLALVLLVTPYVGSWDFVVLFPLLIWTYVNVSWQRKIFLWGAYCVAWFGMARVQMLASSHNHFFWWVPGWFIGAMFLARNWKLKAEKNNPRPNF